jgi:DNA replication protein DnaC
MMDKIKLIKLTKDRHDYVKRAAYNKDNSLKNSNESLYLEAGDLITHAGFALRELQAANLDPLASKQERIKAFADFWFPLWDIREQENEAKRVLAEQQRAAMAARNEEDARWRHWKRYGPPPRYADRDRDDFDVGTSQEEEAYDRVLQFDCVNRSILAVLGTPGTRKTQLLSLWLREEILEYGEQGQFVTARDLIRDAKSVDLMKRYTTVDRLVIDDLGSDANDVEIVLRVVDTRLNNKLPTAYSSNATPKQLREIYGARGFSRLMCNAEVVILDGRDWRIRLDLAAGS